MYNFIINPITNKKVDIFTNQGNNILKRYLNMLGGSSSDTVSITPKKKPIIFFDFDKTLAIISVHKDVKYKYDLFMAERNASIDSSDKKSTKASCLPILRHLRRDPVTQDAKSVETNEPLEVRAFKASYSDNLGTVISNIFGSAERIGNLILLLNFLKYKYSLQVITHNWEDLTRYTLSLIGLDKVFDKIIGNSLIRSGNRRHTVTERSQTKVQYINNLVMKKFKCYLIDDTLDNFGGKEGEDDRLFAGIVINSKKGIKIETVRNLDVILKSLSEQELFNESG